MAGKCMIDIVTHCYAGMLKQYAAMLNYQLSSLVLHRPERWDVRVTVCHTPDDTRTVQVVDYFTRRKELQVVPMLLAPRRLFRRSIGRNLAAMNTPADAVWFSDADHLYGEGCLDKLMPELCRVPIDTSMVWPKFIQIHKTHELGDTLIQKQLDLGPAVLDVSPDDFMDKHYDRAIGGVQIVSGDFAREFGYLRYSKRFQRPRKDDLPFGDFWDDIYYRRFCREMGFVRQVRLPNLFRIRHTATTYQGEENIRIGPVEGPQEDPVVEQQQ